MGPDRVAALALYAPMVDTFHPKMDPSTRKAIIAKLPFLGKGFLDLRSGCCRCLLTKLFGFAAGNAKARKFNMGYKMEQKAGPVMYEKFTKDPFWISAMSDSQLHGPLEELVWTTGTQQRPLVFDVELIKCPVSIWIGENDQSVPVENGKWLQKILPQATLEVVPGCGHFLVTGPTPEFSEQVLSVVRGAGLL